MIGKIIYASGMMALGLAAMVTFAVLFVHAGRAIMISQGML